MLKTKRYIKSIISEKLSLKYMRRESAQKQGTLPSELLFNSGRYKQCVDAG